MAGNTAQATAERAEGERLVQAAPRRQRGAAGRSATADALRELEADGWTVLHDVKWPGRRSGTVDHVVIGNGQVYVIDTNSGPVRSP